MQNMADLLYDSFFYQDPEGKLHPRLATKYDVSADGERFLMIKPPPQAVGVDARAETILVQNWTEELKRLVPTP